VRNLPRREQGLQSAAQNFAFVGGHRHEFVIGN
jgi:hypothetical protein